MTFVDRNEIRQTELNSVIPKSKLISSAKMNTVKTNFFVDKKPLLYTKTTFCLQNDYLSIKIEFCVN